FHKNTPNTGCPVLGVHIRTSLKKNQLCLWPARSASHLTAREKPAPRHQRENQLKEKTSSASGPRGAQSHLTEREN
ncbi:MAG: hypothetical protein ACLR9R_14225, partial [Faecalibacterium prausnitzii]